MLREDYLMRLIRQVAQFLGRILKLRDAGQTEAALKEVNAAFDDLFGSGREWLRDVDSNTMATMLEDPDSMRAYAQLLEQEGLIYEDQGKHGLSQLRLKSALELLLIALAHKGEEDAAIRAQIHALSQKVPATLLASAYAEVLEGLREG